VADAPLALYVRAPGSGGGAVTGPVYVLVVFVPVLAMRIAYLRGVARALSEAGSATMLEW